jgi:hypothetical protein
MVVTISRDGDGYLAEVTPPHAGGTTWSTSVPVGARELVRELTRRGCHQTDIGEAFYEADPAWILKLQATEASDSKSPFLVAYDYGMGGLWGVMLARSADEIRTIYPELGIAGERPAWMSEETYEQLADDPYDIDGAPRGLLNALLADRHHR